MAAEAQNVWLSVWISVNECWRPLIIHVSRSQSFVIHNHRSVFFVVLIIQILLLLQHASEIQSSEMLFVAVSQYYNIVFSLNCTVMSFV